jgi:UDP-N-acetylglucosamine--dolichyl-phosphate N-acetylglucosaminephosphotransferase
MRSMKLSAPTDLIPLAMMLCTGFLVTFLVTTLLAKLNKKLGIVGIDVHKIEKPKLPEMCGLAIAIGLICSALLAAVVLPTEKGHLLAFVTCVSIAAVIGVVDDLRPLSSTVKPLLTVAAAVPIVLLGTYVPYVAIPFLGTARLTIVYPLLVLAAIPVLANAINMLNPFNGAMSGTCSILSLSMIVYLLLLGRIDSAIMPSALLGSLLAFHWYNRYPAKLFSGDAGDLTVGAAIGALTIMGQIEVPMLIAMIPHITNAFYLLSSVGGLRERREIPDRPTRLLGNGKLEATQEDKAPITLSRIILAEGPLRENEIVNIMIVLTVASSLLGLLTLLVIPR